ncbi:GntR family transcriptional regulator [Sphingobium sp. DEHP117]|uniref:FadR/GntR family transcriptional regulator n=1 Tax=Sphingobium sp. DEHP117 TaxID=2993436 RepID=UPI0027D610B0|nr:GntR family transcriptional regulator [Sphingobium sp. DEHP117]MDQ4419260.1 GntR family transcriptional regulator [Sphingobium sp. DEHP117]
MDSLGGSVRIPKTSEVLARRIRRWIINGELPKDSRLPQEAKLMEQFDVSRPTLREAIRILEWEGMIEVSRGARGGARVTSGWGDLVSRAMGIALQTRHATLAHIHEVRSLIEPPAARLAAERNSEAAADALGELMQEQWWAWSDAHAIAEIISAFHQTLLQQCGNPTLEVFGVALQGIVAKNIEMSGRADNRASHVLPKPKTAYRSQERLVSLIRAGDSEGAENHWRKHMAATQTYLLGGFSATEVIDVLD